MARFEPFAGVRYREGPDIGSQAAPPYDVISPAEREVLAARSPHNAVDLELPLDDPAGGRNRFEVAAGRWHDWQSESVLQTDPVASFYVYRMSFRDEAGADRVTTGVIGALELVPPGQGDVLPHERTTPKPKSERLDLQRACRANLSPVWGLSMASGLTELIAPAGAPAGERLAWATDDDAVTHELWALPGGVAAEVSRLVEAAPVVLADGHHRYETALAYRQEVRPSHGGEAGPADLIMALVVELSERELSVQAIHRLLRSPLGPAGLIDVLAQHFDLTELPTGRGGPEVLTHMEEAGSLAVISPDSWFLARPKTSTEEQAEYPLDSSRLEVALAGRDDVEVEYQHGALQICDAVEGQEADLGVLLRPAKVALIESMARQRLRMPAKTTFFSPKPRTGFVFRSLD